MLGTCYWVCLSIDSFTRPRSFRPEAWYFPEHDPTYWQDKIRDTRRTKIIEEFKFPKVFFDGSSIKAYTFRLLSGFWLRYTSTVMNFKHNLPPNLSTQICMEVDCIVGWTWRSSSKRFPPRHGGAVDRCSRLFMCCAVGWYFFRQSQHFNALGQFRLKCGTQATPET